MFYKDQIRSMELLLRNKIDCWYFETICEFKKSMFQWCPKIPGIQLSFYLHHRLGTLNYYDSMICSTQEMKRFYSVLLLSTAPCPIYKQAPFHPAEETTGNFSHL